MTPLTGMVADAMAITITIAPRVTIMIVTTMAFRIAKTGVRTTPIATER